MDPFDGYYLVKDFAMRIGRTESTVRKWINKQIIPAVPLGSLYLIPKESLAEMLRKNVIGILRPNRRVIRSIRRGLTKPFLHSQKVVTLRTIAESHGGRYVQDTD